MLLTQASSIHTMKNVNTMCARCGATQMLKFAALLKRFCHIAMILELLQSSSEPIASVQVINTVLIHCIGRFQAIKTDVLLIFSFITGDKTEFLSPIMFSNEYITDI